MSRRDIRGWRLVPGDPISIEVKGADGSHVLLVGVVDAVPHGYAGVAERVVVRDAQARPLEG